MRFDWAAGATPIDPDEAAELVPKHISTQAELNAWEQANIVSGEKWANYLAALRAADGGLMKI